MINYLHKMKKQTKKSLLLTLMFLTVAMLPATFVNGCTTGGPGSDKCSIKVSVGPVTTDYSVSCRAGYYACCDAPPTGTARCIYSSQENKTLAPGG